MTQTLSAVSSPWRVCRSAAAMGCSTRHSHTRCGFRLRTARGRRYRDGVRHAPRRRRDVPAGRNRGPRRAPDARRALSHSARDRRRHRCGARAGRTDRRDRHDQPARARIGRGRVRPRARRRSRNASLHHAGLPVSRRRPALHELPPAEIDAADARRRRSPATTTFAPRTRTRSRIATASSATATRCCSNARRRDCKRAAQLALLQSPRCNSRCRRRPAARARGRLDTAHGADRHARVHAGRHLRHRQGDGAERARSASARRSCSATRSISGCGRGSR